MILRVNVAERRVLGPLRLGFQGLGISAVDAGLGVWIPA